MKDVVQDGKFWIAVMLGLWLLATPKAAVPYDACISACAVTRRGLWAWTPTSCECTP
ncbi:MAG: hypothetical protein ABMA64_24465 [Myxococcota bacterium]